MIRARCWLPLLMAGVLGFFEPTPGHAQIELRLETAKASYLQYARLPFTVRIRNLGGETLRLEDHGGRPWLEFVVQSSNGLLVPAEKSASFPPLALPSGQSTALEIDLAPTHLIREPGGYQARASVRLPSGETVLTDPLTFLVGRGEVIWSQPRGQGPDRRVYSLLKFYEDPNTGLYLQVEVPEQNQVFPSRRLGPYLPLDRPAAEFDPSGHLHLLYGVEPGRYRLTVVNQDGNPLREEQRQETTSRPALRRSPDGQIDVEGGAVILPSHLREKLSTLQGRLGTPPPPAASGP